MKHCKTLKNEYDVEISTPPEKDYKHIRWAEREVERLERELSDAREYVWLLKRDT